MNHCGTQRLETERLILRRFEPKDAGPMFRNWACDPEVTKFLTWQPHVSAEATGELLEGWIANYENENYYNWAIVPKGGDEPIGNISAVKVHEASMRAEIGYCLGKEWWHRGIMSEALKAVMDFLFDRAGFNRIEAHHDVNNPRSGMVMQKCGMKYEGTLRSAGHNNQGLCDMRVYALLKDERNSPAPVSPDHLQGKDAVISGIVLSAPENRLEMSWELVCGNERFLIRFYNVSGISADGLHAPLQIAFEIVDHSRDGWDGASRYEFRDYEFGSLKFFFEKFTLEKL